jgi:hypothetical protein
LVIIKKNDKRIGRSRGRYISSKEKKGRASKEREEGEGVVEEEGRKEKGTSE